MRYTIEVDDCIEVISSREVDDCIEVIGSRDSEKVIEGMPRNKKPFFHKWKKYY